ncbi:unnamed protein product [Parajaminaea phylloscopi]
MSLTASSSGKSLGSRSSPEERQLPGRDCGLSYPSAASLLINRSSPAVEQSSVSPRLNNKEPFRPTTRRIARQASGERSMMSTPPPTWDIPSPASTPMATPRLDSSPQATPRGPSRAISSRAAPEVAALARASSPIKLTSPRISKPAAVQLHVRPSSPTKSSPHSPLSDGRPSSPMKIRAKITHGISPKRKQSANVSPQKPNVVRAGQASGSSLDVRGASAPYSCAGVDIEEESETSTVDTSFVFCPSSSAQGENSIALSSLAGSAGPQSDAVAVHLRLRPLAASESSAWCISPLSSSVSLQPSLAANRSSGGGSHRFDAVHTGSSNDVLYKTLARPLVHSVLSGINALIFAYGQTASGKTFTLSGDDTIGAEGITQKAVKDLFRGIKGSKREREWLVRCSWLEVYNEGVKDLLEPSNAPQVRASQARGTFVSPLAEVIVTSPAAIFALLEQGQKHRHVNSTDWNERSSRSHTAFKIVVESWARGDESRRAASNGTASGSKSNGDGKKVRISELVLVDLAGSEKYVTTGGKERRAEGANINKSLLTLGKVIYALSERDTSSNASANLHIPYRDSKLTRILQNSLSGNSKIAVVATLNQSVTSLDESLSTINFAKRIKKVKLSAKTNEVDAPESSAETQALLVRYRTEADALRQLVLDLQERQQEQERALDAAAGTVGHGVVEERIEELEDRLREIGRLVVHGEGEESDSDSAWEVSNSPVKAARAFNDAAEEDLSAKALGNGRPNMPSTMSSAQPSHLDFTLSATTLRQQLHAAHLRISSLQGKLSSRPSLSSSDLSMREKDEMILRLQRQLGEAEIALEASTLQPLPKTREDVEAEYASRISRLEKELREAKEFSDACQRKCEKLERVNARLVGLAHRETAELVGRLKEDASPRKMGPNTPRDTEATPGGRRLRGMASAAVIKARPMSVLGNVGVSGRYNRLDSRRRGLSGDDYEDDDDSDHFDVSSPASTPKPAATATMAAQTSPSALRRSARNKTGLAVAPAPVTGVGALTRSGTVVMSLHNVAASDDENADESALIDF